jgi:hypothetical protein
MICGAESPNVGIDRFPAIDRLGIDRLANFSCDDSLMILYSYGAGITYTSNPEPSGNLQSDVPSYFHV